MDEFGQDFQAGDQAGSQAAGVGASVNYVDISALDGGEGAPAGERSEDGDVLHGAGEVEAAGHE